MVVIGSLTAIADNINIKKPTKVLTRPNEVGVPVAEVLIEDVITADLTVQVPDAASAAPARGATFSVKDIGGSTLNLKVSETGAKFEAGGETKIPVSARQRFATGS